MSTIRLDLNNIKASGVYTFEFDQSDSITLSPQTVRLVVGFSKKGVFNAPVFCPDIKTARAVFGDIDTQLERKGSFFHRSLFTCLRTGPVFALNLLALNDDETSPDTSDKVNYKAFSVDTAENNGVLTAKLASSFYNKQKFWFADPEYFLGTVTGSGSSPKNWTGDKAKLLDFVNLGKTPMSIIVKKSTTKGYDLTAKEWYASLNIPKPEFLNDNDFINDFFLDVIAIEGDWTNYAALSVDPVYSKYFDIKGFIPSTLTQFTALPEINLIASITGCIIPDFIDANNSNQFIETLVNNSTLVTGLFCAVNKAAFDDLTDNASKIDLVGHNLISALGSQTSIDLISYKAPLINDQAYSDDITPYYTLNSPWATLVATKTSQIYLDWKAGVITDGDYMVIDGIGTKQYLKFFALVDGGGNPYVEVAAYEDDTFHQPEDIAPIGTTYDTSGSIVLSKWNIISLYGSYNEYFSTEAVDPQKPINSNECLLAKTDAAKVNIGDLMVDDSGLRLTRILKKSQYNTLGTIVKITCSTPIKFYSSNRVQKFKRLQDFVTELQFTYLQGFTLKSTHMPDGTDNRMNEILDVMTNTNIAKSLASKDIITFRYVVDTFWGGLEPESKYRLTSLAMSRSKCLAILNAPSMKQFAYSTDPIFTDEATASNPVPILDIRYIPDGGNQMLNPSFSFSLTDQALGSQYAGYFAPFIVLRENNKNIAVPPAALVSNLFVQKFLNGTPFSIVAGPRRGMISDPNLVGVEYDFTDEDRAYLEPFGINPLVRRKGEGVMIYANQTGYQRISSALNNLHVRDLLITIESDVETILSNYLFEFNDPSVRLEIKSKVENYLEGVQSAGGIYNFEVVMDSSNNTPEIIDQNIGIIDVVIEPARGLQKIINRITIVKTGAIASGGFTLA